eukprot:Skav210300  [mRNA]  locus=scaffold475:143839:144150:- [translate_table: standard]
MLDQPPEDHLGLTFPGSMLSSSWSASASGPADVFGFSLLALPGEPRARLAVGSPYFGRDDSEQMHPGTVHVFAPRRGEAVSPAEAAAVGDFGIWILLITCIDS